MMFLQQSNFSRRYLKSDLDYWEYLGMLCFVSSFVSSFLLLLDQGTQLMLHKIKMYVVVHLGVCGEGRPFRWLLSSQPYIKQMEIQNEFLRQPDSPDFPILSCVKLVLISPYDKRGNMP